LLLIGLTDANTMSHIATQGVVDGKAVTWMEQVTDEQHRK
jgi:hypothetical protein